MDKDFEKNQLRIQATTMNYVVELLNAFNSFMDAPGGSPIEDQADAALRDKIAECATKEDWSANTFLAFCHIVHSLVEPEEMQRYLNYISSSLSEEAKSLEEEED